MTGLSLKISGDKKLKRAPSTHFVWQALQGVFLYGALFFTLVSPAYAQFKIPPKPQGLPEGNLPSLIAQIVKTSLLLVGVIALAFVVYGGFRYITSRGDEREVEEAKNTITYAVIGIVVIGLAYAIIDLVFRAFGGSGGSGGGTT